MARNEAKEPKQRPHKLRYGSVVLNIWSNPGKDEGQTFKSYTFERIYKDKDNKWNSTSSLSMSDLSSVKILIDYAMAELVVRPSDEN